MPDIDSVSLLRRACFAGAAAFLQRPTTPLPPATTAVMLLAEQARLDALAAFGFESAHTQGVVDVAWRDRKRRAIARSVLFADLAARVSQRLQKAGITHAFWKGVAMDEGAWRSTGLRGTSDVDVVVDDLDGAERALSSMASGPALENQHAYLGSVPRARSIPVRVGDATAVVDVHGFILFSPPFVDDTKNILQRRVKGHVWRVCDDDAVAFAAANALQDGFSGLLKAALDTAVLAAQQRVDWAVVLRRARAARASTGLAAVVQLIEAHMPGVVPAWCARELRLHFFARRIAQHVLNNEQIPGMIGRAFGADDVVVGVAHALSQVPGRLRHLTRNKSFNGS